MRQMKKKITLDSKMMNINNDIYIIMAKYLLGPKIPEGCYQIGDIKSNSFSKKIKIQVPKNAAIVYIYFGTDIRVSVRVRNGTKKNIFYNIFDFNNKIIPENIEDYKYIMKTFLMELIRLVLHFHDYSCYNYYGLSIDKIYSLSNCTKIPVPKDFDCFENKNGYHLLEKIATYPYSWERKDILLYMIDVFKSKRFKRMLENC